MSAFVVDKRHIDAIVQMGLRRKYHTHGPLRWVPTFDKYEGVFNSLTSETANAVGQMLVDECVKSVSYRYQDSVHEGLPGPCDEYYKQPYHHQHIQTMMPTHLQTIKLIQCYEYQSCEHPEWHTSQARSFCQSLKDDLIGRMEGYDDADWSYRPDPRDKPAPQPILHIVEPS